MLILVLCTVPVIETTSRSGVGAVHFLLNLRPGAAMAYRFYPSLLAKQWGNQLSLFACSLAKTAVVTVLATTKESMMAVFKSF